MHCIDNYQGTRRCMFKEIVITYILMGIAYAFYFTMFVLHGEVFKDCFKT